MVGVAAGTEERNGSARGISSSILVSEDKDEELETLDVRGFFVGCGGAGSSAGLVTLCVAFLPEFLSEILSFRGTA